MFHYQRVWENPRKYAERLLCPALPSGSCWETPCENCAKVCHPLVLRARMEQRTNPASCTSKSRPMVVQHIPIHKLGSGKVLFVVGVLGWNASWRSRWCATVVLKLSTPCPQTTARKSCSKCRMYLVFPCEVFCCQLYMPWLHPLCGSWR